MQPILDIRAVNSHLYTYSLCAAAQAEAHRGDLFDSAERCLLDAGQGLTHYFDQVQIRFAGFALGSYPVTRMVEDPLGLFQELMARVLRIYRLRAAPRWRPQAVARERLSSA
ncbi:hypothetical protein [Variovorax sp. JS1663]|uniref:hypothetical protein n=1 Tax=Variovorax sp. JS1663 TaxID=1851577 RepID=UPI000B34872B|nr:hypothetical protein [Variovorax sp. JS1663]OUM01518.1 hypothetical protein A8M77_16030 [Variovorax sp. JS1663]